ncbi:DUF6295 family protein [Microbispora hainanensis]|jgi:hypothetical protein|uniref:DUF6295 family protein n=1 Tax=Microbispora hainanensis TaxID=568844 RepID=A0ABZ1SZE5_9ACTN|nr:MULTISPECIES: DUF6295 family protein [Microbispora]NJP28816.1 hypothetical protein [Microbispora sp. CL1-1]TQS07032.1 hypothetical protein FLW53_32360 [Microbispora sp. SCL1-1]
MCTYLTEKFRIDGAAKGGSGWFTVTDGMVYVDHPYHATQEHTVNIDLANPAEGPSARVAIELTEEGALALVEAIHKALAAAPPGLASAARRSAPASASA